jgi:methionyl-tRNA formyltransferase
MARGIVLAGGAPRTILDLAAERDIPVLELGGSEIPDALAGLHFDAITVACFSRRLPASLLRLPRLGCLNVHPSLLPAHRGPDPLFWIFHDGGGAGGVTIHLMDEGFDTGPIVLQENVALSDDTTEAMLDLVCARRGGELLAEALAALNAGTIQPQPQDASRASYESWPTKDDYTITPAWSARRAYRFIQGVGGRGEPIRFVAGDGATFVVRAALDYDADATLGAPWRLDGDTLAVQCAPGVLRCQIAM